MPILHAQFSGRGKSPEGQDAQLPPLVALLQRGPVLQVAITIAEQIATELVKQGLTIQPPVAGFGLIDTGASVTCVDEDAAKELKLPVVDVVNMSSASHAAHQANVYPVRIGIAGLPHAINAPRAVGAALKAQGLIALLGRDILAHCTLFYNGAAGEITLSV